MKKQKIMVFLLAVLLLMVVSPVVPLFPNALGLGPGPSVMATGDTSSGLSASIDVTYEVLDKCSWDWVLAQPDRSTMYCELWNPYGYMMDDDNDYFKINLEEENQVNWVAFIYFYIESPYTDLKECNYAIKYTEAGGTLETDNVYLYFFTETGSTYVTFPDSDDGEDSGTETLGSDYVVDRKIHGCIQVQCIDNEGAVDSILISIDKLAFEYNTVPETRRSSYSIQGGTIRYTVDWTTWDYNVNTTLSPPSDWTFKDVNPDCEQTSDEYACLVPEDYEAVYTMDVLSTSCWEEVFAWSFEDDGNNFTVVLDGSAAYDLGSTWYNFSDAWGTSSWIVWSSYGSVTLDYTATLSATAGSAGEWTTTLTHAASVSFLNFTGSNCLIDAVAVYQTSVSTTTATLSGNAIHVHPNGYTPAAFVDVELGLWDATYAWQEYATVTTDANGAWTLATSDLSTTLSAQTYRLWTWVYSDANGLWDRDAHTESTTDWTTSGGRGTDSVQLSTTAHEGRYSVEVTAQFDTDDYFELRYTASFDASNCLVTLWLHVNDTTGVNLLRWLGYGAGSDQIYVYEWAWSYGGTVNTWFPVTVPLDGNYLRYDAGDESAYTYHRILVSNSTNTDVGYAVKIDSVAFLEGYTRDTLTYPFTVQDEVTMHFSYYMADGSAMLFHTFKTYVDSERIPGETPWHTTTSYTVNLTITDVWNDTVYQDTTQDVAEFVDVVTTSYWFIFTNQRDYSVNVTIEHNSHNVTMGDPIGPGEGFSRIFYTGDYTIYCWRSETGELEEGFPKDGTVADRWEVYTEKSTGSPSGPGGLTLIDLTFTVLKSVGVAMFVFAIGFLFVWKVLWPWLKDRMGGEDRYGYR